MLLLALLGAAAILAIAVLSFNVIRDLRSLNSARTDNVQWTLSQTEIEFMELESALLQASNTSTPDLTTLRRRFDVFYSRVTTLSQAQLFATLRDTSEFLGDLKDIQAYRQAMLPAIDGADSALIAELPALNLRTDLLHPTVRRLAGSSLVHFAQISDARRATLTRTLSLSALAVAVLTFVLAFLIYCLINLNRQIESRRQDALQTAQRLQVISSTALDAIIVCNADGEILDFNAAAETAFGQNASCAIGCDVTQLIAFNPQIETHQTCVQPTPLDQLKHVRGKGRVQMQAKRADGSSFPVELAIQAAQTAQGEIFIAFMRDISRRQKAESALIEARDQALAGEKAKTDFMAIMSHEIRTPLNGLLGHLPLLQDTSLSPKQKTYLQNMEASGRLLINHITDVLDITSYEAGKLSYSPAPMNLSILLQDIIDSQYAAAQAQNTTLDWSWISTPSDWVNADQRRVQHILMNLIGNAIKFTHGGKVSVQVSVTHTNDTNCQVSIRVMDTGIGIDLATQASIFDDFVTGNNNYNRSVEGTGLGLGIARRFAHALGGTISVNSTLGEGSCFEITFPSTRTTATAQPKETAQYQRADQALEILLVEDNEINQMIACEMIQRDGHHVTQAFDGAAGVAASERKRFDLIFMDISMPVMDGCEATMTIRAGSGASKDSPIVALTANVMPQEQQKFLDCGMNQIISKPLSSDVLRNVLAQWGKAFDLGDPSKATPRAHMSELRDVIGVKKLRDLVVKFSLEVDDFLKNFPADLDKSQPSTQDSKNQALRAHQLAGVAATLGARELHKGLLEIEAAQEDTKSSAVVSDLRVLWPIVHADLLNQSKA